jgi:HEAT repeat protein
LERLLRERRILVIVDHFSEMSNDTREEIQPAHPEFPFNALVFTSRNDEKLGVTSTIEPYRIEGNRLSSFMDSYLTFYKRRDEFTDVEFFDYCSQLSRMIGERKTTPLLIILYARQMIAAKSGEFQEQLPKNIPDLMLRYLSTINASVASNKASNREVHRDMKLIAWQCLRNDFKPHALNEGRFYLRSVKTNRSNVSAILKSACI